MLSCLLPLLQEWKTTSVACSQCCATGGLAYFLTGNSRCVATVHTVRQWGWLPVAPFRRGWHVKCESVLKGIYRGFFNWRVGGCLRGSRRGTWRAVCRGFCRCLISLVVGRCFVRWCVCRRLIIFIIRRLVVGWGIRKRLVRRCISQQIVGLIWADSRRTALWHRWDSRRMVDGWCVGCGGTVCGWRVGGRCVSRPRLGRGGGWAVIFKQIEFSGHQVIVSIWRAVWLVLIVGRVVGRVIITRVAHGESGGRYSDDDKGGTTEDRHGRWWSLKESDCRRAYPV